MFRVLSLFDGISCAQVAINRLGLKDYEYYAAEIDKHAITVTQKNYPNTIQLGDVTKVKGEDLPKIDLLVGGSPCQGFSYAGKQLNFEDDRSKLFFEYVRILKEVKPKYFLLENVKMKKEYQNIITEYLGVEPIEINSSLLSAQNRRRLYWTNLEVEQPKDKGILLKDILTEECEPISFSSSGRGNGKIEFRLSDNSKAHTLTRQGYSKRSFTGVLKKPLKLYDINKGGQGNRVYSTEGKGVTLLSNSGGLAGSGNFLIAELVKNKEIIRKLTPVECERLQTLPDGYTEGVSDTQRRKALGNGFTVDVIAHILKGIL